MCSTSSKDSVVRGHHIYKATWTPVLGEELPVLREPGNIQFLLVLAPFTNLHGLTLNIRAATSLLLLSSAHFIALSL